MDLLRRLTYASILGIAAAAAAAYVTAYFIRAVIHGAFFYRDIFLDTMAVASRAAPFLAVSGVVCGLVFLRRFPQWNARRRVVMLVLSGALSVCIAVAGGFAYAGVRHAQFHNRVVKPQFTSASTEADVRAKLGTPHSSEIAPNFRFVGNFGDCKGVNAAKNLIYIEPGGGAYRVLYFGSDGKYVCEANGAIYY